VLCEVLVRLWLQEDGMHGRRFIALLSGAVVPPCAPDAQQKAMTNGYLASGLPGPSAAFFGSVSQRV
jgi:hypothetical protein